MRKLRHTLFFQLSVVFLLLLAIAIFGFCGTLFYVWTTSNEIAEQRINRQLASHIASVLQPMFEEGLSEEKIKRTLYELTELNPHIEVFVLDANGSVILTVDPPQEYDIVPPELLQRFMDSPNQFDAPIRGPDLARLPGRENIFSAAPLTIGNKPAWVYVVLLGTRVRVIRNMYGNMIVMSTGFQIFFVSLALSLLLAVSLIFLLTRRFSRMTKVLQSYQGGDYSKRISVGRKDEIGQHGRAINSMADRIEEQIQQLTDVDTRRRQLFANISHELRRPITLMHSTLETLIIKADSLTQEQSLTFLERSLARCQALDKLIAQLFELSKLSSDLMKPEFEHFSLSDLVSETYDNLSPRAEEKSIQLSLNIPTTAELVYADSDMIETVVSNLIENAIRYTPDGGTVKVSVENTADGVCCTVRDTGVGIPEEDMEYIFDRFYRSATAKAQSQEGTGLGLAIVKKILELHHSTLEIESKVSVGSSFRFVLASPDA